MLITDVIYFLVILPLSNTSFVRFQMYMDMEADDDEDDDDEEEESEGKLVQLSPVVKSVFINTLWSLNLVYCLPFLMIFAKLRVASKNTTAKNNIGNIFKTSQAFSRNLSHMSCIKLC